jgi:cell division protein ZapA (FtsZ GTPase activity inhibitor)
MKVQITIRGRTYTVRSDDDEVDLPTIARYVDTRMEEVSKRASSGFDGYTVAMLAALNIASDFERFRRDVAGQLDELDKDLASTAVVLQAALPADDDA